MSNFFVVTFLVSIVCLVIFLVKSKFRTRKHILTAVSGIILSFVLIGVTAPSETKVEAEKKAKEEYIAKEKSKVKKKAKEEQVTKEKANAEQKAKKEQAAKEQAEAEQRAREEQVATEQASANSTGYTKDSRGRWHRPNGQYASKAEIAAAGLTW